jgi:putative hydrolase of the HAD superfamily
MVFDFFCCWCKQVGSSQRVKGVDYALESIHNIKEAVPELWESVNKSKDVGSSPKIAIETPVEA